MAYRQTYIEQEHNLQQLNSAINQTMRECADLNPHLGGVTATPFGDYMAFIEMDKH
jgi:hypothetical protein